MIKVRSKSRERKGRERRGRREGGTIYDGEEKKEGGMIKQTS